MGEVMLDNTSLSLFLIVLNEEEANSLISPNLFVSQSMPAFTKSLI